MLLYARTPAEENDSAQKLMQDLLTLAILAVLVACGDRVHAIAGGAVGRGAV